MPNELNDKGLKQSPKTAKFVKEVKSLIESGEVKSYAVIADKLDWSSTMLSNVINGRQNIPNDKYRKFTEVYSISKDEVNKDKEQIPKSTETFYMNTIAGMNKTGADLSETNKNLSAATKETALANRILAENQRDLIEILKLSTNSQNSNQIAFSIAVRQYFDQMAIAGTKVPGLWKTQDEGLVILDKLLGVSVVEMQSSGKHLHKGK